jgi:hypothetical protein
MTASRLERFLFLQLTSVEATAAAASEVPVPREVNKWHSLQINIEHSAIGTDPYKSLWDKDMGY